MSEQLTDGRIRRGDRTRRLVLGHAVDVASVDGLEGLSIGRLATDLSMSKSGLIAHFGSKEELQLATVRAARAIFAQTVIEPALQRPPGLGRVRALLDAWLEYSSDRRFPGGCFFARATHEFAAKPGATLTLQLVATTVLYAKPALGGTVTFSTIRVSVPTVK